MSRRLEREIARRLKEHGAAEPPADLLGRIQAEIPDSLAVGRETAANLRELRRPALRRPWLLAASLVAMFGAGVLSYRLFEADRALVSAPRPPRAETAPAAIPAPVTPPAPENRPAAPRALPATPPPPAAAPEGSLKKQRAPERESPSLAGEEPEGAVGAISGGVVGGIPGGTPGGEPAGAGSPGEPAPAPAAPAAPAARGPAELQEREEARLVQKAAPSTAQGSPAAADRAERAAPAPPQAKSALAKPERFHSAAKVAAPTATAAEGAPSPFAGEGRRIVLLLLPVPPEAEVTFDPAVATLSRRLEPVDPVEPAGPGVLYEVELRPGAPAEAIVAGRNGEPLLRVRDLAPSFERASAGFRLAALEAEVTAIQAGTRPRSELPELRRLARTLAADPRAAALLSRLDRLSP